MAEERDVGDVYHDVLADAETRFAATGNPVHVFEAMSWCFTLALTDAPKMETEADYLAAIAAARFPPWVMRYLHGITGPIHRMGMGRSPDPPLPADVAKPTPQERAAFRQWQEGGFPAGEAVRDLARIMGFIRPGRNEFERAVTRRRHDMIALEVEWAAERLGSRNRAYEEVAATYGLSEARAVQRIVEEARARAEARRKERG